MPPLLVGITGRLQSGKGTAALGVQKYAEAAGLVSAERGFADLLKWSAARLFWPDVTREEGVAWGNAIKTVDPRHDSRFVFQQVHSNHVEDVIDKSISGRALLQRYGTESHRDIFGEDFWVDQLLPLPRPGEDANHPEWWWSFAGDPEPITGRGAGGTMITMPDFCVITDLRFENEAERIKELGGFVWEIQRPGHHSDGHPSEAGLPLQLIDTVIKNDGSVDDLIEKAKNEIHALTLTSDPR